MYEQLKNTLTALLREAPAVPLYKQNLDKPLDTGCGYLAASLGRLGELRSLSAYHAQHGWMVVNTLPPFPADKYFEPEFVRQYRRAQADLEGPGFGLFPGVRSRTSPTAGSGAVCPWCRAKWMACA